MTWFLFYVANICRDAIFLTFHSYDEIKLYSVQKKNPSYEYEYDKLFETIFKVQTFNIILSSYIIKVTNYASRF